MEGELKELKSVLRSLVVSSPAALTAQALLRDYRQMMGVNLPITRFGYRNPITFLKEQCGDCFLFQGPATNPTLTLIVPDSLKHIDKFVQKQKTAMKGKIKRRSVPESSVHKPQNHLVASTFHNNNCRKNLENTPVSSTKANESRSAVTPSISKGSSTTCDSGAPLNLNNKENVVNNRTEDQNSSQPQTPSPAGSLPSFLRKRLPIVESLKKLEIEDEDETSIIDDNKSGRGTSDSGRLTLSSSSSSKQLKIETLKREIFEIVDEHPDGVLCADLTTLYRQRHGRELNFLRLGHMSLLSLTCAMGLCAAPARGDYRVARAPLEPRPAPRVHRVVPPRAAPGDPDDALPGVPYEKDIFPADCLHYMDSIPGVAATAGIEAGSRVDVLPAEVYSPSHLWLILLGERHHAAMEAVMDDMNVYYKRGGEGEGRELAAPAVRVGHYVACLYEGDWHRAIIVRVLDCDTVKVRHIDYGTVQTVPGRTLRPLLRRFGELPAQAVRARLADTRPAQRARRWQHAAALRLLAMLRDTPHVACVQRVQDDILEVFLINTTGEDDVCVNEELVRQGYAEAAAADGDHDADSHLYPVFAALEAGATPSLNDCLTYLRDGIELDYVEEYRRHVPPLLPPAPPPPAETPPRAASPPTPSPPASPSPPPAPPSPPPAPPARARPAMRYPPRAPPPPPTPRLSYEAVACAMPYGGASYMPLLPPPGFGWPQPPPPPPPYLCFGPGGAGGAGAAGGLSVAECEMLSLVARVRPALAQRFVSERLGVPGALSPLNPLAPEFHLPRY